MLLKRNAHPGNILNHYFFSYSYLVYSFYLICKIGYIELVDYWKPLFFIFDYIFRQVNINYYILLLISALVVFPDSKDAQILGHTRNHISQVSYIIQENSNRISVKNQSDPQIHRHCPITERTRDPSPHCYCRSYDDIMIRLITNVA